MEVSDVRRHEPRFGLPSAIAHASGRVVATSAFSINLLSAARVRPLRAAATPLRVTRRQGVAEVQVLDTGKDNRLVAMALVTVSFLAGEAFAAPGESAVVDAAWAHPVALASGR